MADALRALRDQADFLRAARIQLVELSPRLRALQRQALTGYQIDWHENLGSLDGGPMVLLANEFFDALPIRQFQRTERGWCERMIGLADERLALALAPDPAPAELLPAALRAAAKGSVAEISPARDAAMGTIAERVAGAGGAALVIDYGHGESAPGDTLQAVRRHAFAEVLQDPGQADLTAHVDFAQLAAAARAAGAAVHGPIGQGLFLENLGISVRARKLAALADERQAEDIAAALARLTEPAQMGTLFKVLAVTAAEQPAPAGFEGG
jgi:NADH dehydrogenase [ubiquinone] 1 alpha subcomplex assembly factor 7